MADKGWTAQTAAAAGVAAGTGAAQLGLGYGLGVVVWPTSATAGDTIWLSSLGWATWIAAGSTVFGAIAGSRTRPDISPRTGTVRRLTMVAAAAVGALLTVALIAVPARSAYRVDTFSPQTTAAGYAVAGILIGILIAYWAVASRPVAANVILTAVWLWSLAVAAIVHGLVTGTALSGIHLSGWRFDLTGADFRFGAIHWPSALLMLGAAFVIGALAVWPAVRRGDHGIGAATSGAVGPLLMALTFLLLVPRVTTALGALESPYLAAPYAVLTGLAGSALMVALAKQAAARRATRAPGTVHGAPVATPMGFPAAAAQTATARAAVPARTTAPASIAAAAPAQAAGPVSGSSAVPISRAAPTGDRPGREGLLGRLKPGRWRSTDDTRDTDRDSSPPVHSGRAELPKAQGRSAAAASAEPVGDPESQASTVAPPPRTPAVARINSPEQTSPGPDAELEGTSRAAARPARSTGRSAESPVPPGRRTTRPRKPTSGSAGPADEDAD